MAPEIQTTISPHNQQAYTQRTYPTDAELDGQIARAAEAQKTWRGVALAERIAVGRRFMDEFGKMGGEIPEELTLQMGRPVTQGGGEIRGTLERAGYMLDIAAASLADVELEEKAGFRRWMKRVPVGVVFVIAPWNFPYLTSINCVLPALVAGNSVLLKPSPQTPLTAERLLLAFTRSGLPAGALQVLHLSLPQTRTVVGDTRVAFTSFTGSVQGGRDVQIASSSAAGFSGVALELGGKDAAYVRPDADLAYTAAEIADGAFFNSGQSCCAVERVYVHEAVYPEFIDRLVAITKAYTLGDPTQPTTNLGPVVSLASAHRIRKQVADAIAQGAKSLIPESFFPNAQQGTTYVAPQILIDVTHEMDVMTEETFGPILGVQKVCSDDEALALMNDSRYGLTASVWTRADAHPDSEKAFLRFADELEVGTVFLNRCDYLDPALAWTGVKDSGRGVSLSKFGYDQLTRAKSVHMKINTT